MHLNSSWKKVTKSKTSSPTSQQLFERGRQWLVFVIHRFCACSGQGQKRLQHFCLVFLQNVDLLKNIAFACCCGCTLGWTRDIRLESIIYTERIIFMNLCRGLVTWHGVVVYQRWWWREIIVMGCAAVVWWCSNLNSEVYIVTTRCNQCFMVLKSDSKSIWRR